MQEIKKTLVIGSTVTDVIIRLPHLPKTEEDLNVSSQKLSLGGCSYNASDMLRHFKVPYTLFSPIGSGVYGDFVKQKLSEKNVTSAIPPIAEENGCCYCFVEADGKRTFVSVRGAEYHFKAEWFDTLNATNFDFVYVCGLDLENESGQVICDFLKKNPHLTIFFAPGPRLASIDPSRMNTLFSLHPILHLNKDEACLYTGCSTLEDAMISLYAKTQNTVIVTNGAQGACLYDAEHSLMHIPPVPAAQIDTIGAGDSHIGTTMACLAKGYSLEEALTIANKVSSKVVETEGALLSDKQFLMLDL